MLGVSLPSCQTWNKIRFLNVQAHSVSVRHGSLLLLPNATHLQVVLMYRSPSVSSDAFLSALAAILNLIAISNIPSVVLADFNEDLLQKPDSRILSLMSSNGYQQLAQSPTTDRGTLIDHVYFQ